MLNYIWLGLIVLAVIIGGCTDNLKEVADKSFEMAEFAVMKTALPLVGIMALWLGIMRLAERAGLVALLARALRPLMVWLFPDVPADHPAMGSMLLNMAASILGLGNAATPLGLKAMKDLETLNPRPGTATNAMCTYLAINTSSIQLIPATAIAVLAANKSSNPTAIVGTSIMATTCAAVAAVTIGVHTQCSQRRKLQKRRARIQQVGDPVAGQQFASRRMFGTCGLTTAQCGLGDLCIQSVHQGAHGAGIGLEVGRTGVELGIQLGHRFFQAVLSSCKPSACFISSRILNF